MGALLTSFAALKNSLTGSAVAIHPLAPVAGDFLAIPNYLDRARWYGVGINFGIAVALDATDDSLVGTSDYALLGITPDQPVLSIGIKGPDTGNYRIACPGHWNARLSAGYFVDQDARRPTPHIPIINALNKA